MSQDPKVGIPSPLSTQVNSIDSLNGDHTSKSCWAKSKPYAIPAAKYGGAGCIGAALALAIVALVLWSMGIIGADGGEGVEVIDLGEMNYPKVVSGYNELKITMQPVPGALSYDPKYYIVQTKAASGGRRLRESMDGAWSNAVVADYKLDQAVSVTIGDLSGGDSLVVRYKIEMADGRMSSPSIAVVASTTTPSAPDSGTFRSASTTTASVSVTMVPPSNTNGAAVTGFVVEHAVTAEATADTEWTSSSVKVEDADKAVVVDGLAASVVVLFRLASINAVGQSPFSAPYVMRSNSADAAEPGQVVDVETAGVRAASVTLSWTAASDNGAMVLQYVVSESGSGSTRSVDGHVTSVEFGGLQKDTEYTFTVQAENSEGLGEASDSVTATTSEYCQADAPQDVSLQTPFSDGLSIMWSPPSGGTCDLKISGYRVLDSASGDVLCEPKNGAHWCDTTGLSAGTSYQVVVQAKNEGGWSDQGSAVLGAKTLSEGKCASRDQIRWWISTTSPAYDSQDFVGAIARCATKTMGNASGMVKCLAEYTADSGHTPFRLPEVENDCLGCYGENGHCGMLNCSFACGFGSAISSQKCIDCNNQHCKQHFYKCSGLCPAVAPPDPISG